MIEDDDEYQENESSNLYQNGKNSGKSSKSTKYNENSNGGKISINSNFRNN